MPALRVGVVGIGNMGFTHAQHIFSGDIQDMILTAVCDIAPEKLTEAARQLPGVARFADYTSMLHSGLIDAVIISTPHYLHPIIAVEAFQAGLHVLTEKPAGVSVSAVRKMNRAAAESGKVFAIMWNQRTHPLFKKAREILQSGQLGTPKRLVWIITNWYRTQSYYDSASWRATWRGEGGGVLLNQAPHNLDLWQWLFGMPDAIQATCAVGRWHNIEVEDDATIQGFYKSGATATFITSTGEYPGTNRLEISGSRGKMVLEKGSLHLYITERDEREFCFHEQAGFPVYPLTETVYTDNEPACAHNLILQNFTNGILHDEPLISPGTEGIRELTLSNAAYLSAWENKRIDLPLDAEQFNQLLAHQVSASKSKKSEHSQSIEQENRWKIRW